jgi:transcriptional regulator with XRE-family HTH domain
MNSPKRTTGLDLKFSRLTRGIHAREIAAALSVSPQRISAIEATFHPSSRIVARYLAALDAAEPKARSPKQDGEARS